MVINPIVFSLGGIQLHAYTVAILLSVAIGMMSVLWRAYQLRCPMLPWLDCVVGAVFGGVIGARLIHVVLSMAYFSAHPDQITSLTSGGLDWHGAIFGGVIGLASLSWLRRVPFDELTNALALVFPLAAAIIWAGSGAAAVTYGKEVGTLADFPAWLVTESPDVYGLVAPRLDLPHLGIAISLMLWGILMVFSFVQNKSRIKLWLAVGLFSILMAFISFFRGDIVVYWLDHRADQVLDLAVLLLAALLAMITLLKKGSIHAGHNRTGPNVSADRERSYKLGHASKIDRGGENTGR